MKLIDLLVQELPKRGGWPDGEELAYAGHDGEIRFPSTRGDFYPPVDVDYDDRSTEIGAPLLRVTRDQYESALAASQKPAWNGDGLPPVGCRVEYACKQPDLGHPAIENGKWYGGIIIAYYDDCVWTSDNGIRHLSNTIFRPIRTKADQKRYASIEALFEILDAGVSTSQDAIDIYYAIAAGKIPGVKLED